jgi:hypothetical protein
LESLPHPSDKHLPAAPPQAEILIEHSIDTVVPRGAKPMIRRLSSVAIAAAVALAAWGFDPGAAQAGNYPTSNDLFYNYYAPPGDCGGVPAQLYLSPRPTPPVVGHTYITYQPLMPHELLYPHARRYWTYHPSSDSWTRTLVTWQQSPFDFGFLRGLLGPATPARGGLPNAMVGTGGL